MNEARTSVGRMIGAAGRALGVKRAARAARGDRHRRGTIIAGFTLIEVLVAVGAVAIVAVGLAAIFDAVGKTVTGGRRVNTLNQAAAVLESRMRQDFAAMTRDGFLVIRQQFADANNDRQITRNQDSIPLAANEPFQRWRIRRIDEIMFYTRGDFASAREPLHPAFVAKSDSARVYYGHGQRRIDDLTPGSLYLRPSLADSMGDADGSNSKLGRNLADNPNRFASDWSLLRLQTVLADPATANQNAPQQAVFDLDPRQPAALASMLDRDYQVALQPAAASIFRTMSAERFRLDLPNQRVDAPTSSSSAEEFALWSQVPPYAGNMTPVFASGLVDVATTSLEEIRSVVMQMNGTPADMVAINETAWGPPPAWQLGDPIPGARSALWAYPATNVPASAAATQMRIARAWMDNAMPTKSDMTAQVGASGPPGSPDLWPGGIRVRYEPEPPDYMGVITDSNYGPPTDGKRARALSQARADQLMLSSNNFLPRCTEFQIEWSFGQLNDNQQIIWYGGWQTDATGTPAISRYSDAGVNGFVSNFRRNVDTGTTQSGRYRLDEDVLYGTLGGAGADQSNPNQSLTTYFGYVDTTFNPSTSDAVPGTVIAWPWPKMFRVTVRLADPRDPRIEETFQFVFESPQR